METTSTFFGFLVGLSVALALALLFFGVGEGEARDKKREHRYAVRQRRAGLSRGKPNPAAGAVPANQEAEALDLPRESSLHIPPADVQKIEGVAPRNETPAGRFF